MHDTRACAERRGWSLAWASDQAGLARSSPATWVGLGPARKKNLFKKKSEFSAIFYMLYFNQ